MWSKLDRFISEFCWSSQVIFIPKFFQQLQKIKITNSSRSRFWPTSHHLVAKEHRGRLRSWIPGWEWDPAALAVAPVLAPASALAYRWMVRIPNPTVCASKSTTGDRRQVGFYRPHWLWSFGFRDLLRFFRRGITSAVTFLTPQGLSHRQWTIAHGDFNSLSSTPAGSKRISWVRGGWWRKTYGILPRVFSHIVQNINLLHFTTLSTFLASSFSTPCSAYLWQYRKLVIHLVENGAL